MTGVLHGNAAASGSRPSLLDESDVFVGERRDQMPQLFQAWSAAFQWMQQVRMARCVEVIRRKDGSLNNLETQKHHRVTLTKLISEGQAIVTLLEDPRLEGDDELPFKLCSIDDVKATLELLHETYWLKYGPKMNPNRAKEVASILGLIDEAA